MWRRRANVCGAPPPLRAPGEPLTDAAGLARLELVEEAAEVERQRAAKVGRQPGGVDELVQRGQVVA